MAAAVVPKIFAHEALVGGGVGSGARVNAARVIVAWVVEALVHELVAVAVGVHLGPVVVVGAGQAGQMAHAGRCGRSRRVGSSGGQDRRPLVRAVRVLLHVLGQVGLLGVALAAVRADVGLEVLGLLVLGDVLQQGGLVREALVAGVALVRLVSLVASGVGLQVRQLGERLRATWEKKKIRNIQEKLRLL